MVVCWSNPIDRRHFRPSPGIAKSIHWILIDRQKSGVLYFVKVRTCWCNPIYLKAFPHLPGIAPIIPWNNYLLNLNSIADREDARGHNIVRSGYRSESHPNSNKNCFSPSQICMTNGSEIRVLRTTKTYMSNTIE
jgi:hypothetical protein